MAVNCAALPPALIESELFGYEEGSFTGAKKEGRAGVFELAHGGTLLLDEISEIPLPLQGRLLRVLQEKEVMRIGADKVIPVDVKIICASNRDLQEMVRRGPSAAISISGSASFFSPFRRCGSVPRTSCCWLTFQPEVRGKI